MHSKTDAKGISAFAFNVLFIALIVYQVNHLRALEDDPAMEWYVFAGIGVMALLVLISQVLSAKVPRLLQEAAGVGIFVFQWFDWEQMPLFAVAYLACLGLFLVPYLSKYFLHRGTSENLSEGDASPRSILPYYGIAIGVLLGRYLLLLMLMDLSGVYQACLVIGTIISLVEILMQSRTAVLETRGNAKTNQSMQARVIFALSFLLMESYVLARYTPALFFWPIETYIEIRLGAIAITTIAHLFTDGQKHFAPVLFLAGAAILLVWGNIPLTLAIINLLFEVLLINMLFTIPSLPTKQDRPPSRHLRLINLGFWFVGLLIFVGGQFIFFYVDELYQFLTLVLGGGVIFATWVKPAMIQRRGKKVGDVPS